MNNPETTVRALRHHLEICQDLLKLVEEEGKDLNDSSETGSTAFQYYKQRQEMLTRLQDSVDQIKQHRTWWQQLSPSEKQEHPEIEALIRNNQDLIMKVVYLDRENEKSRLRQGLFNPQKLPASESQRPHFVADLYQRNHTEHS